MIGTVSNSLSIFLVISITLLVLALSVMLYELVRLILDRVHRKRKRRNVAPLGSQCLSSVLCEEELVPVTRSVAASIADSAVSITGSEPCSETQETYGETYDETYDGVDSDEDVDSDSRSDHRVSFSEPPEVTLSGHRPQSRGATPPHVPSTASSFSESASSIVGNTSPLSASASASVASLVEASAASLAISAMTTHPGPYHRVCFGEVPDSP
ncbi:hypothetical protein [Eastern grey kangaroopox virus]|uniref:Uncharacterized protein n=1 Tax=Eastern grey kangaroopox virus TaxID=2042482 RepID=A0A2C9DTB1_9POXV|nr:hypothetical protein KM541_gp148 [Eastern grey kangaroopox virus]ATI21244.1 hypothetical protein [Eastern grey kangaroopox virus]ATX75151.1 hypothetical protein EKPV-NSW-ORF164 [Eastern grey kangaroopox virus]